MKLKTNTLGRMIKLSQRKSVAVYPVGNNIVMQFKTGKRVTAIALTEKACASMVQLCLARYNQPYALAAKSNEVKG